MLSRKEAKKKIEAYIANNEPVQTGALLGSIRPGKRYDVYNIPLDYLVPNVLNDRIAMRIREYEAEIGRKLSFESEEDIEYVYTTIYNENKQANDNTLNDLAIKGQEEYGVITCEGIVVSGNRRTTLLRKLYNGEFSDLRRPTDEFGYLKCIVLDDSFDTKEIQALETITQMGKDKQVDYNRINLYIKVDNLFNAGYNYSKIREYMGLKSEKEANDMHDLYKFMCEYLTFIGQENHFSLLDGLEDQMIKTKTFFKHLDSKSYDANWNYTDNDVADFKLICYDYLQAHYEGKEYRDILLGKVNKNKGNGVFTDESVWRKFLKRHNDIIESHKDRLVTEADWKLIGSNQLKSNLEAARTSLDDIKQTKSAKDLIDVIDQKVNALETIIIQLEELEESDVEVLKSINKRIYNLYKEFK